MRTFSDKISGYQDSDPPTEKLRFIQSLNKDFRDLTMPLYCARVCYTAMNGKDIIPDLLRVKSAENDAEKWRREETSSNKVMMSNVDCPGENKLSSC